MLLTPGKLLILAKWVLTSLPTTVAVDITHRCNLKCLHCYWWKQDHPAELDDGRMIALLKGLRARGLAAAILYGGEPTLRPEVCRAAGEIFDATLAFTNGINGFPELKNVQWILSLDGPQDLNDTIRGAGVYAKALENLKRASQPPIVHMTISRLNQDSLDDFVREMMRLPIKGMGFSFYTPDLTRDESGLFIPLKERDRLIMELLSLRRRYGEKIGFTPAMARQLLTAGDFYQWNRYAACPVSQRVRCFKSNGQPKACTYGDSADCSRCGCAAVAAYRGAFKPFDYPTLRLILGLMVPELRVRKG
ncbi:MAG: Radical core protein [Thermodesulfobacteriota bacterium]|nr:Radical core protein [Thermodesulfobacteriota bacterium]